MYKNIEKNFMEKAKYNNRYSDKIVGRTLLFSNIWTTLLAPILIGFGISYLFGLSKNETISPLVYVCVGVFFLVHLAISYLVHQNNSKYSLYSEAVELENAHKNEITELRHNLAKYEQGFKNANNLYSNQSSSLYLSASATDQAIGQFRLIEQDKSKIKENEFWEDAAASLETIIRPLVLEREALFGYKSDSLYNIALYFYDENKEHLFVVQRDCDSRLPQRNRNWKPGYGHVGLAFLHKEAKICPDINLSNELLSNPKEDDEKHYRSFISIPILRCEDDGNVDNDEIPLGVLVLTSAHINQFHESRDLHFLTIITKHLAIYLATVDSFISHYDFDNLPSSGNE